MSNHAHFIIRAELNVLSEYMSIILSEYAVYYNFKHSRNGHVFQNRFYSECIESETYYWSCLRYIHLNPVKARIVKKAETYKYSSMYEYSSCCTTILSERALTMVRQHFGEIEEFKQFHQKKAENVFFDLNEEIKMQQEEVALEIAKKIQKEYKMKLLCQVVEEKETRNVYEEQLKDQMGLSKRRIKELCLKLK